MGAFIAGVVLGLLIIPIISHRALRGSRRVIVKHLLRDGDYSVKVGYGTAIWNPQAPPFPKNSFSGHDEDLMPGRGLARYSYDESAATIHLRWEPRDGHPQDFAGQLPAMASRQQSQKAHRAIAFVIGLMVVCFGGGAAIGAIISGASTRFAGAMIGMGAGCVVYVISARLLTATAYFRNLRRPSSDHPTRTRSSR